ncbi:alpha/beta hydrolase [Paenibacillus sp.]|uniref:alpha/beta hydrolase n=1 Tax=Paenibacillus sp. TaxID=58172 RepID=UPI0028AC7E8E|nr:alpha/beta hydrolase [Paenibacillus sp.]
MLTTFTYKTIDGINLQLDHYSTGRANSPALVYFHGGGLITGSRKEMTEAKACLFTSAGIAVLSVDYRLAPETKLPAIVDDVQDALHWIRNEGAMKLQLDPGRMAIMGSSAGGFLAMLAGTFPEKPQAIVSMYGYGSLLDSWTSQPSAHYLKMSRLRPEDIQRMIGTTPIAEGSMNRFLIYLYCRQRGVWAQEITGMDPTLRRSELEGYCPLLLADSHYPPAFLAHGDQDRDVPYGESLKMANRLMSLGNTVEWITVPGADHIFDQNLEAPPIKELYQKIIGFLEEHF